MDKKWYLFEGDAEGRRADVMLLSEAEAKIVNHVLDHMIHMVDEGYSGCLYMRDDLGGFDSKEDAFKAYCKENPWVRSDDVCEEFRDMYKEEKTEPTLEEMMHMYRNSIASRMMESIRKDCEEE